MAEETDTPPKSLAELVKRLCDKTWLGKSLNEKGLSREDVEAVYIAVYTDVPDNIGFVKITEKNFHRVDSQTMAEDTLLVVYTRDWIMYCPYPEQENIYDILPRNAQLEQFLIKAQTF